MIKKKNIDTYFLTAKHIFGPFLIKCLIACYLNLWRELTVKYFTMITMLYTTLHKYKNTFCKSEIKLIIRF